MASAAASRPPPPPPPPPPPSAPAAMQWLSPRVSFSLEDGGGGAGRDRETAGGACAGSADFEFLLAGCSAVSMLPADELFSGGKLVPLRVPAGASTEGVGGAAVLTLPPLAPAGTGVGAGTPAAQPETPRAEVAPTKVVAQAEAAAEEPKIPARRWRDLLRLRKQQASSSAAATSDPKPLRRLLRRGPKPPEPEQSLSLPLLRESSTDEPEKPAPAPAPAPTTPTPPPPSQQLPPKIRLSPAQTTEPPPQPPPPPPPPTAVAADSPRLNAAGKVVFNGLGRSSSSPSSLAGGRRHRGGGSSIERSYSAHVRVAPVLNVPVCSLRGSRKSVSVFGIDRLFSPSSSSTAAAAAIKNRKAATKKEVTTTPQ